MASITLYVCLCLVLGYLILETLIGRLLESNNEYIVITSDLVIDILQLIVINNLHLMSFLLHLKLSLILSTQLISIVNVIFHHLLPHFICCQNVANMLPTYVLFANIDT